MLYDLWRTVARQREGERALVEVATGRTWTFGELLARSDDSPPPDEPVVYPGGRQVEFVFEVLRGWRHQRPVCPLESPQTPPRLATFPREWVHLKTTSATTGAPRLIGLTAEQLAADPANLVATMQLRPDWPNLGAISLAHSYGFSNLVLPLLLHGIPLILAASALPEAIRIAGRVDSGITLPAVPALWRSWLDAEAIPPGIRLAISAGAPLPLALEAAVYERHHLKIHNFYGASECGGIAYDATAVPRTDATLVGSSVSGVDLAVGTRGCLVVRGPNVASGYWPAADPALERGAFQTTDLVDLRNGAVHLLGRSDDLINVAGRKVSPDEIEQTILRHPAVRRCLVFGVGRRESEHGEFIVAVVEGEPTLDRTSLERFLGTELSSWQMPRDWWFVDDLPPDHRGKWLRREWKKSYLEAKGR